MNAPRSADTTELLLSSPATGWTVEDSWIVDWEDAPFEALLLLSAPARVFLWAISCEPHEHKLGGRLYALFEVPTDVALVLATLIEKVPHGEAEERRYRDAVRGLRPMRVFTVSADLRSFTSAWRCPESLSYTYRSG